ncbi:hypothetical protein MA03_07285 [Infirmifilum uzonense]|uniref:Uncharacterized protein n=1 Tax=Infirmifilum uzonense TaxID=1550241 RepID=A0A0F7FI71_9CREN|nr:hypothetical protein MA03_07285 [Infirmifilum uzonense]
MTLLALASMVPVEPIYAYERGHMQCAQLVHVARACLASGRCTNETLQELVSRVLAVNATEPMLMYPVLQYTRYEVSSWSVANRTVFTIKTLRASSESVEVYVLAASYPYSGKYRKFWLGKEWTLYNLTLWYMHSYASPFFNVPQLCPRIYDPSGLADVKPLEQCLWRVGVPGNYTLRDEFGIPVRVVVRG